MKIAIFSGTFDPFTESHYKIVNTLSKSKIADNVVVLPTIVDYYRKEKERFFSNENRIKTVEHWFSDEKSDNVILDKHEYDLLNYKMISDMTTEYSTDLSSRRYVHMLKDTIERYDSAFSCKNEYFTVIGEDSLSNFKTWHNYGEILSLSKLIVFNRGNERVLTDIPFIPMAFDDDRYCKISATEVRKILSSESLSEDMQVEKYFKMIDYAKNVQYK